MLIASAAGLVILGASASLFSSTYRLKGREDQLIPLQETLRGAAEIMSQDLREATGTRVILNNNIPALPASTNTSITITDMDHNGKFSIPEPNGNSLQNSANTPIIEPNYANKTCEDVFVAGDWALVTSGNWSQWVQVGNNGGNVCLANSGQKKVLHVQQKLTGIVWTPAASFMKMNIVQYYLGTDASTGSTVLYRKLGSADPQIVAFDITDLKFQYSTDGLTYTNTPASTPASIRLTITGRAQKKLPGESAYRTYSLSQNVFMRRTTLAEPTNP
ncbi:PilW family protein [Deinococcus cellulosilyticus]|uniref:Uncharacterized protein n=1 Tax=Deinococcus cellulosilyticus (strain DSM 18568 / NBRC 106333 / KACC 11606 / 5516J-15) TaxID=1223518 RepID=A0A511N3P4_DEIC1|nr:hypothetical protein [Deinococcus cellulosilyticus]GEM47001.1 hypothetical protein DC3_26360 [Deinococcus cellulosilyticus NBRC 106333 = KACC 11606]